MNDAFVSVIIPTYNRAALVVESVESVLAAVAPGDEVIVVDDGSTDDTEAVLSRYLPFIRYVRVANGGVSAARNIGISLAKHDLIALNDSDDLWLPDRLRLQRQIMECCTDVVFSFSNFGGLLPDGTRVHNGLGAWLQEFGGEPYVAWKETLGCAVPFSQLGVLPDSHCDFPVFFGRLYSSELNFNHVAAFTALVRRSVAGTTLHFPEDISFGEDWECFARMSRVGPVAFLDCETALQRVHPGPRLTAIDHARKAAIQLSVLRRVWGADEEFLAWNRLVFERTLARTRRALARALLVQGQTRAARRELRQAGKVPIAHRALTWLPGPFVKVLLSGRQVLLRAAALGPARKSPSPARSAAAAL